jgi:hypothetical protein
MKSRYVNINAKIQYIRIQHGCGEHERDYDSTKEEEEMGPMDNEAFFDQCQPMNSSIFHHVILMNPSTSIDLKIQAFNA